MNIRQRRILIIVAVAVTGMLLYPPLRTVGIPTWGGRTPGITYSYDWLWADPFSGVNFALLFTQFFVLGVVSSIAFVLNADQKKSN